MTDNDDYSPDEQRLLDALAGLPAIEAPDLEPRFRARLRAERSIPARPRQWIASALAASLLLTLAGGWWIDRQREEKTVVALRAELTASLTDLSAARRYQAVAAAEHFGHPDHEIVAILVTALLTDSSANVRAAAATALGRLAAPDALRDAAMRSLHDEGSPFVQAAVLSVLPMMHPSDRAALLRKLLLRPNLDPTVRAEAERQAHS